MSHIAGRVSPDSLLLQLTVGAAEAEALSDWMIFGIALLLCCMQKSRWPKTPLHGMLTSILAYAPKDVKRWLTRFIPEPSKPGASPE